MLIPKGQAVYERLSTSFTQVDVLLDELKGNTFSGYLRLSAPQYENLLFVSAGAVVNGFLYIDGQAQHGNTAVTNFFVKSRERGGTIGVFRLPPGFTDLLARLVQREALYKDLASDFTRLDRLLTTLVTRRHAGCVDIRFADKSSATIFLQDGTILETLWKCADGTRAGDGAYTALLASTQDAVFTVYSASVLAPLADTPSLESVSAPERTSVPEPAPAPETAAVPAPAPPAPQAIELPSPGQLAIWQDVLKTFESTVDVNAKVGTFLLAFKRACTELSDTYAFLDPFETDFEYRDGRIRYQGREAARVFNEALGKSLAQSLRALMKQRGGRELPNRFTAAAETLKRRYGDRLAEIGVRDMASEFFG